MKSRQGKGTPHPKAKRPPADGKHQTFQELNPRISSFQKLHAVHAQVAQTLHKIDAMVLKVDRLASSKLLALSEVQEFTSALAMMNTSLEVCNKIYQQFLQFLLNDFKQHPPSQEWSDFLDAAAEGPTLSPSNEQEEHMVVEKSTTSTSSSEDDLSPLRHSLQTCTISYSPLVAGSLETESPYDSGYLALTPTCKRQSSASKEELSSPLPDTPCMPSPPRSVRVLSTISESSYVSTPSELQTFLQDNAAPQTPKSEDLLTPEYLTCNNHLVFETPPVKLRQDEQLHDGLFVPQTPGFGTSPPRTCVPLRPGENISVASATRSQTPSLPSPFRTPGISLKFNDIRSESSSDSSPAIVDDFTASVVKRLGPRGLGERLWHELEIRKADILKPVKSM